MKWIDNIGPDGRVAWPEGASARGWHSLTALVGCPTRYRYEHVLKLVPMDPPQFAPKIETLQRGKLVHVGRAQLLVDRETRRPPQWEKVMGEYAAQQLIAEAELDRAVKMVRAYNDAYGIMWLDGIAGVELLGVEVLYESGDYLQALCGGVALPDWLRRSARFDAVFRRGDILYIDELKTTSRPLESLYGQMAISGQVLLQTLIGDRVASSLGLEFGGVRVSAIGLPPRNGNRVPLGTRLIVPPAHQIRWFADELLRLMVMAQDAEAGRLDLPHNLEHCWRCPYTKLCVWGPGALREFTTKEES